MAGRFSRTYSRKRPQPAPPISQFDALVKEGTSLTSNQPAATKTAGHLGKWGITSFTSLRAINGGKEEGYKRSYSGGADSPSTSPSHCTTDVLGSASHNNGENMAAASSTILDKPVVTYKRRKFFKSRGAPDEAAAEGQSSSGVSSGGSTCLLTNVAAVPLLSIQTSNSKSVRDPSRDFDSLLAGGHDNGSSRPSHKRQTITLPSTLPESRSPSPPSVLPSISAENKPVSTGIKLKIFKSRSSESSWVQDQYSSRVELPSDDSKSSTDSSSMASSPSSVDVNDFEKESSVPENNTLPSNSRYPCRTQGGSSRVMAHSLPSTAINLEMSSQSSIESTLPISSTSCEDRALHDSLSSTAVEEEANINVSLDSSAEFGEIIDQRTGLPICMYNKALTDTSFDLSDVVTSPVPKLVLSAASNVLPVYSVPSLVSKKVTYTYTKNVSKSREINKYLNKNSQPLPRDSDSKLIDTLPNSYLDKDKVEISSSAFVSEPETLEESNDKCDRIAPVRFSARSYGSRTKSSASSIVLNSVGSKTNNALDVRNSIAPNSFINTKPSTSSSSLDFNSQYSKAVNTTNVIAAKSTQSKSLVPDLFSSGFDEEEIIDRTLVDYSSPAVDSGAESNGIVEENTQELDAVSADACDLDLSKASTSGASAEGPSTSAGAIVEPLRKCTSLPTRNLLRSMPGSLAPGESSSSGSVKSVALPRKRSIFKSRVEKDDGGAKKRPTYNHKWHSTNEDKDEEGDSFKSDSSSGGTGGKTTGSLQEYSAFDDFDFDGGGGATLKRVQSWSAQSSSAPLPDMDESTDAGSKVTSVKCNKGAKQFYTVIKNVKKLHQLQESGEFQEFNDDVEYFLDALRSSNSASTRCLAALNLAHKCMVPAFRMHLRAHATVCKFFRALQDAPKHPGLSLCSAMVMFALSQDRLNMDLDRDSLELMLNLLDSDGAASASSSGGAVGGGATSGGSANGANPAMAEAVIKIRDLCRQLQKKGHAKHLDLDSIDTGTLAMETLLSLTSKRAGEWFKEELRELGGVDHLVRTVTGCVRPLLPPASFLLWTPRTTDTFSKVERCLKVLENVTHQNESNQDYLLQFQSGVFASTLMDLFSLCHEQVPLTAAQAAATASEDKSATESSHLTSPTSIKIILPKSPLGSTPATKKKHAVASGPLRRKDQVLTPLQSVSSALITSMKVLVNLTHNSRKLGLGSKTFGAQARTYNITLRCLLVLPQHLLPETRFEVQVLSCCLLLNLVEHSEDNRAALMKTKAPLSLYDEDEDDSDLFNEPSAPPPHGAMRALVSLFYSCEASAREHEAHTDQIIDRDLDQTVRRQRPAKEEGGGKEDDLEETVARLLQKAGRHMEDTLIAAYTALLTGYCIMDNKECEEVVRALQPEGHFRSMVTVLKKFLHFMDLTATTSLLRSLKPTERVVKYMEKLDPPLEPSPVTVAERERQKQDEDEDEDDFEESFGQEPSDSLVDAFGF